MIKDNLAETSFLFLFHGSIEGSIVLPPPVALPLLPVGEVGTQQQGSLLVHAGSGQPGLQAPNEPDGPGLSEPDLQGRFVDEDVTVSGGGDDPSLDVHGDVDVGPRLLPFVAVSAYRDGKKSIIKKLRVQLILAKPVRNTFCAWFSNL